MGKFTDLAGKKFGRLTVVDRSTKNDSSGNIYWNCVCSCTKKIVAGGFNLKSGHTKSCGCLSAEIKRERQKHGDAKKRNVKRLYYIWVSMRRRCLDANADNYKYYGERGITITAEWSDYREFKMWALANGYAGNLSIDRIDPNGNYEPSNCRWADATTQARNTRIESAIESGRKGVYWHDKTQKWRARITVNGKTINGGLHENLIDAISAREQLEAMYWV